MDALPIPADKTIQCDSQRLTQQCIHRQQGRQHRQATRADLLANQPFTNDGVLTEGVKLLRNIFAAALSALVVTAAVPFSTAKADPTCGTNAVLDRATNTCKPIYSTPTAGCDPTVTGDGLACFGGRPGGWMDIPITADEMYSFICHQLFINGVSVGGIEDIFHTLYTAPYNLSQRDAGRTVALAIQNECPEYKAAAYRAMQQALPGS